MIVYFADRQLNILGQASTSLPKGLTVIEDLKTEDVETGVAIFECKIPFDKNTRSDVEAYTEVGNYILRSNGKENEFYQIIEAEIDTKNQEVYIYAEDDGMDLLNEVVGEYEADKAYPISHYIEKYASGAGFVIGINEVASLTRKLSWDGESTATERIASVATQFDGCEVSYSFEIDGLVVTKKYINIYKQRGKDVGIPLRLNQDVDRIVTTKSIANLATALQCTGGTPSNKNKPITLKDYSYDDGDFYVDGTILKSRKALERWSRYLWKDGETLEEGGHIVKQYSYDTTSQQTLCSRAITELKKICDMEVNYEVDINKLPENVKVGDRVNIVDDAGELYLSTRILKLETSIADQSHKATLGEFLIKGSGISQKVIDLAAQFAESTKTLANVNMIAYSASAAAMAAQAQADAALLEAQNAQAAADDAAEVAANALSGAADAQQTADDAAAAVGAAQESANNAQTAANNAQAAVDAVEKDVAALETTVNDAKTTADNAKTAADEANTKADEATQAAAQAKADAADADAKSELAQSAATTATTKAETAVTTSEEAKTKAQTAEETAAAAKLDAEKAKEDIAALGEELETVSTTMEADYARKTDLTETEASLQSKIEQNAAQIASTVTKVQTIDETANDAKEQAEAAQSVANTAKEQADAAKADAEAAQTAADGAAAAAASAQTEADNAKTAAATAQSIADRAEADLEEAKANLATVTSRVDATEADIVAAQQAVETAQTAADKAKTDADAAAKKAANAQSTADTAVTNAASAQAKADEAADKADIAQAAADEAKGNASAAQATADQAAAAAAAAQSTANTAKTNAENAQTKANQAAADAAKAQSAADDADAKAAQAAKDLEAAEKNLADVTSRVGATEEEVEAAKKEVEAAKLNASVACDFAQAAQSDADTAKQKAEEAQTAANNAKTAADNAQKAADDAQDAADKAQAAADALAVRVTTAETKITQNSEAINLRATKEEVATTLSGYYTKTQTDAAINLSANGIRSEVQAIEIGGRNLVPVSKIQPGRNVSTTEEFELRDVWATSFMSNENLVSILEPATEYTARYNLELIERTNVPTKFDMMVGFLIYSAAHSTWVSLATQMAEDAEIGTTKTVQITFTTPDVWNDEAIICYSRRWTTNGASPVGFDAFKVTDFKIEKGNKATDWTPAPEDVDSDIADAYETASEAQDKGDEAYSVASETKSVVEQLADAVVTLIKDENGSSVMTQTSSGWTFNLSQANDKLNNAAVDIGKLTESVDNVDVALKQAINDLGVLTDYVIVTTYNDQPCIELGEAENQFKLRITNTEIQFVDGSAIPAYISNKKLMIEQAEVTEELKFGNFAWKIRNNGNMGLSWKGASS